MQVEYIENIEDKEAVTHEAITKKYSGDSINDVVLNDYISKFLDISEDSKETERKDKRMSLMEGLKTFPKAAMWSVVLSSTLIMEGYDTNLVSSFYTFPGFNEKFGKYYEDQQIYQIPAKWQIALSMSVNVGEILGLFASGIIVDKIGYRKTLMGALALVAAFIFIVFFAPNIQVLLVGEILLGLPWGAFQTLCVTYATDVCPLALLIYLTTYANACWVIGQLLSSGVLRAYVSSTDKDAYKIPYALQWIWPLPLAIGVFLAPESPWWLSRKGKLEEAKKSLKRLLTKNEYLQDKDSVAEAMLTRIQMTLKEESNQDDCSYLECVRGDALRRTLIASVTWLVQNCTGAALMGYSTYFYKQAGLPTEMSFTFSIIQYVLGLIGTLLSWTLSQKLGRFPIYFGGVCVLFVLLFASGCFGIKPFEGSGWAVGTLLLIYTFVYDSTIGPICYCLVAEIPSVRLRNKTVVIARNVYNVSGIVISIITPYMLNPTAWNWKAKAAFLWSGFAFLAAIWCWFCLPETKNRTFAELDQLFEEKVSARKFKSTEVEVFNADRLMNKLGEDGVRELVDSKNVKYEDENQNV